MRKNKNKKSNKKIEVDEEKISLISSCNPWTPEMEDEWLKQPAKELKRRFLPFPKPRHVRRTDRANYFLDQKERG